MSKSLPRDVRPVRPASLFAASGRGPCVTLALVGALGGLALPAAADEPVAAGAAAGRGADQASGEAASAERAAWPALDDPARWTVEVRPRAWYLSPSGDLRLPSTGGVQQPLVRVNDLQLDEPEVNPAGELSLQSGPWRFGFSGATYSTDVSTVAPYAFTLGTVGVNAGDGIRTEFDFTTAQVQVGYGLFEHDFGAEDGWPGRTVGRLHVVGGARFYDLSVAFSRLSGGPAARSEEDGFWAEPFLGAHGELQVARDFSLDLDITGGAQLFGDDTSWSVDLAVAFSWRPGVVGLDGLALQIGWRQLLLDVQTGSDEGEFRYDGGFAGLFFGGVVRF